MFVLRLGCRVSSHFLSLPLGEGQLPLSSSWTLLEDHAGGFGTRQISYMCFPKADRLEVERKDVHCHFLLKAMGIKSGYILQEQGHVYDVLHDGQSWCCHSLWTQANSDIVTHFGHSKPDLRTTTKATASNTELKH